MKFGMEKVGLY